MTTLAAHIADLRQQRALGRLDEEDYDEALGEALAASPTKGVWITGAFDGEVSIGREPGPRGGVVTGLSRGSRPPSPGRQDLPWLAERLDDVRLAQSATEALVVDLHDVRLHDLQVLWAEEDSLRVRATLWARVILGPEDLSPVSSTDRPQREAPRQIAMDADGLVVYGPDTRAVEGSGHGEGSGESLGFAAAGCMGVPAVVAILVALGLTGGTIAVVAWVGVLVAGWMLHPRLPFTGRWAGRSGCLVSLGVCGLAGAALAVMAGLLAHGPCGERPVWWLLPVLLPVLVGLGVRWRGTFLVAASAWSLGLWLWGAVPEAACAVDPDSVRDRRPVLVAWQETLDHLEEATAHDPDADLIEAATDIGGEPRISLDSAMRSEEAWSCGLPIHLSGTVLFEEGTDTLTTEALPHLRRLARLLRRKDVAVEIQGHGPEAGLSGVRARTVTTWLEAVGGVEPDRLTPLGLASSHPVVQDEDLEHYNRRLDVVWPCP